MNGGEQWELALGHICIITDTRFHPCKTNLHYEKFRHIRQKIKI